MKRRKCENRGVKYRLSKKLIEIDKNHFEKFPSIILVNISDGIVDEIFPKMVNPKYYIKRFLKPSLLKIPLDELYEITGIQKIDKLFNSKDKLIDYILWRMIYNMPTPLEKREIEKDEISNKSNNNWFEMCGFNVPQDIMNIITQYMKKDIFFLNSVGLINEQFYLLAITRFVKLVITPSNYRHIPILTLKHVKYVILRECLIQKGNFDTNVLDHLFNCMKDNLCGFLFENGSVNNFNYVMEMGYKFPNCKIVGVISAFGSSSKDFSLYELGEYGLSEKSNPKCLCMPQMESFPKLNTLCVDFFNIKIHEQNSTIENNLSKVFIGENTIISGIISNVPFVTSYLKNVKEAWLEIPTTKQILNFFDMSKLTKLSISSISADHYNGGGSFWFAKYKPRETIIDEITSNFKNLTYFHLRTPITWDLFFKILHNLPLKTFHCTISHINDDSMIKGLYLRDEISRIINKNCEIYLQVSLWGKYSIIKNILEKSFSKLKEMLHIKECFFINQYGNVLKKKVYHITTDGKMENFNDTYYVNTIREDFLTQYFLQ